MDDGETGTGGPGHPALARRFLHVCLNTTSAADAVGQHRALADLVVGMATGVQRSTGSVLDLGAFDTGVEQSFVADTTFLYDHRGPRVVGALEIIEWIDPPTIGETAGSPELTGFHGLSYVVPSVTERITAAGVRTTVTGVPGLLRPGTRATVVRDHDGVLVELIEAEPGQPAEARGVRLACTELDSTVAWYNAIGFETEVEPTAVRTAGVALGLDAVEVEVDVRAARLTLAEEPSFALTLVEWPSAAPRVDWSPCNRGLYRVALRVEDLHATLAELDTIGVVYEGPKWIPLPGTKIGGLTIAFLRDPDDTVVELVERPLALIGKPAVRG